MIERAVLGVLLVTVLTACNANSSDSGADGGADGGAVPADPNPSDVGTASEAAQAGDTVFSLVVLAALQDARTRDDVPEAWAEKERAYTATWLTLALRPSAMKQVEGGEFRFVSDLGPRGDDAVVANATIDGSKVNVVDGRELLFEVRASSTAESMPSLWWQLFGRGSAPTPSSADVDVLELGNLPQGGAHGTIRATDPPKRQFASPVRWYRLVDRVIFAFEKRLVPPSRGRAHPNGGWIPEGVASRYIGGVPPSEVRPYLRFEPTNRESLAKEWARELNGPDEPREGPAYGATKGLRLGGDGRK